MVIGKIKPTATIVAQFAAGVEVDAIQHEGKMFMPVLGMGEFAQKDKISKDAPCGVSHEEAPKKEASKSTATSSKSYTEAELMETDSKELEKILRKEFSIEPDDFDGKNTNKKLRKLILDAQKGNVSKPETEDDDDEEVEDAKPAKSEKGGEDNKQKLYDDVAELLEAFDAGDKGKKTTIASLVALGDDVDTKKVTKFVEDFENDGDADIDEIAENLVKVISGGSEKEEPKKKSPAKKGDKLVDADDLEEGDRVSVWWNDDNQDWFEGNVKSIKKGKVIIAYDDDTEEAIDPKVHTKIKLIGKGDELPF